MLFQDNLMHADLHPGNMILQQQHKYFDHDHNFHLLSDLIHAFHHNKDSKNQQQQNSLINTNFNTNHVMKLVWPKMDKFVLVDAGMVAELTNKEQLNFIGFIESLGEGDGKTAANCMLEFSDRGLISYSRETILAFQNDMIYLCSQVCKGYGTNTDIGIVLRGVLNLIRKHRVTIGTNYATLVMNILCLDSIAKSLLPNYNVLDAAQPLLSFHRKFKNIHNHLPLPKFIKDKVYLGMKKTLSLLLWKKKQNDKKILKKLLIELKTSSQHSDH